MKLLHRIIDKLQATFPPNRIMLLLAGPIVAASAWFSGLVTANIPGVELPVAVVAGVIGGAVLIAITLIYKWFDQWQRGEPIDFGGDIEAALAEGGEELLASRDALTGVGQELADLRNRVTAGTINDQQISHQLGLLGDAIGQFLHDHEPEPEPEVPDVPAASPTQ